MTLRHHHHLLLQQHYFSPLQTEQMQIPIRKQPLTAGAAAA